MQGSSLSLRRVGSSDLATDDTEFEARGFDPSPFGWGRLCDIEEDDVVVVVVVVLFPDGRNGRLKKPQTFPSDDEDDDDFWSAMAISQSIRLGTNRRRFRD